MLEEKDAFRLRQRQLDEGRRQRASKLQDKVLKKRNDHKRAVSQKIQRELLREEDEARAAMALLQQRAAQLKAQQVSPFRGCHGFLFFFRVYCVPVCIDSFS